MQTIYYGITIRAGDAKPQPGSPRHTEHRRRIRILVVTLYLAYTIYEADYEVQRESSFFQDLGVPLSATEREIKSRFRRLAALHHPDKAGSNSGDDAAVDSAAYFIHLKLASDTLQDAAKRFAYERFGENILSWESCSSIKDYVLRGVMYNMLPHYSVAVTTMYMLGFFGYMDFGKFYRWLILFALCLFEVHTVMRPDFPAVLNALNAVLTTVTSHPPYAPFQLLALLRKLIVTVYIALSQIGPLLVTSSKPKKIAARDDEQSLRESLVRLESLSKNLGTDADRVMDMEVAPFKGDKAATSNLQGKMREWLIQNTIRADPMVKDAVGTSLQRRRIDAPAGAKGTR